MNNEETFDWKTAAKYWAEGKDIEWNNCGSWVGKELSVDRDSIQFCAGTLYRLRPEPVKSKGWIIIAENKYGYTYANGPFDEKKVALSPRMATASGGRFIACKLIEFYEGEGLESQDKV